MKSMINPIVSVMMIVLCLSATLQSGCRSGGGAEGTGVLPKAPSQPPPSKYEPQNPYVPLAPGILTRTLHQAAGQAGYRIEVRDMLVGPGQRATNVSLPGAAVFQVRSGSGTITTAGKTEEAKSGSTFAVSDGETFSVENKSNTPIELRVYLFIAT